MVGKKQQKNLRIQNKNETNENIFRRNKNINTNIRCVIVNLDIGMVRQIFLKYANIFKFFEL